MSERSERTKEHSSERGERTREHSSERSEPSGKHSNRLVVFDLDGTLLDSDEALVAPFVALGVARDRVTFGHVVAEECTRLGLDIDAYIDRYDPSAAQPFPGVVELLAGIGRWAVCSNKHPRSGRAELARLGWEPEAALFADAFDGPKALEPVLSALAVKPAEVVFVGDTSHDRACAQATGVPFILAGWNPRAAPAPGDLVAAHPTEVSAFLA
ncbi:N-acetylmuramic acid 6-phosphate phosphatase MupP [soil metagenome]